LSQALVQVTEAPRTDRTPPAGSLKDRWAYRAHPPGARLLLQAPEGSNGALVTLLSSERLLVTAATICAMTIACADDLTVDAAHDLGHRLGPVDTDLTNGHLPSR
jgi:hypothetical protein